MENLVCSMVGLWSWCKDSNYSAWDTNLLRLLSLSVFQGRNCYLKVERILGGVENTILNVCLLITLCKMHGFCVCLLQSSWIIRFVPKAAIFDEERGKMAVEFSRKYHPWDLVGTVLIFHICPGQIGLPGLAAVFYTECEWWDLPKLQSWVVNPVSFFFL